MLVFINSSGRVLDHFGDFPYFEGGLIYDNGCHISRGGTMATVDDVLAAVGEVLDPDLGLPILDLGLIYRVDVADERVEIDFTLTSPACPVGDILLEDLQETVKARTGLTDVTAQIVWDPPWNKDMMSEELKLTLGIPI
jgi:metal-sulfur cluster biosynthetic enzyme